MRWLAWSTGALALLLSAGCGASGTLSGPGTDGLAALTLGTTDSNVYPLELGRTWTYQSIQVDDGGAPQAAPDQRFVVSQLVPGGAVLQRYYGGWMAPPTLARETPDGVVLSRYVASGPQATDSITILKFPLAIGQSWPGRTLVGATERIEVAGFGGVDVPLGHFDAWHIQNHLTYATGGGDTLDYWYAPGMGMVEAIERATIQEGTTLHHLQVTASLASASIPPS